MKVGLFSFAMLCISTLLAHTVSAETAEQCASPWSEQTSILFVAGTIAGSMLLVTIASVVAGLTPWCAAASQEDTANGEN
jgi:hypothetical protein